MTLNKRLIFLFVILLSLINLLPAQDKFVQTGIATYYSDAFQGRYTSCGEKYDYTLYTAAHASLPFQTLVKVTNLANNISVVVKINDRCPNYYSRIIDLSKAAAKKLDIIVSGIANVKLEVISKADLNIINDKPDSLFNFVLSDISSMKNMLYFQQAPMWEIERMLMRNLLFSKMMMISSLEGWNNENNWMAFDFLYLARNPKIIT
jgi:rare lipoprotein A (peptidoglycan hydrolase)